MAAEVAEAPAKAVETVGQRVRKLREQTGLSIPEFARLTREVDPNGLGVHRVTLNRVELDNQAPLPQTATLIAAALTQRLRRRITISVLYG